MNVVGAPYPPLHECGVDAQVNVYTVPGVKQQGQFAVEAAAQIISFFAEYFDIAYPLPKADLVGTDNSCQTSLQAGRQAFEISQTPIFAKLHRVNLQAVRESVPSPIVL